MSSPTLTSLLRNLPQPLFKFHPTRPIRRRPTLYHVPHSCSIFLLLLLLLDLPSSSPFERNGSLGRRELGVRE